MEVGGSCLVRGRGPLGLALAGQNEGRGGGGEIEGVETGPQRREGVCERAWTAPNEPAEIVGSERGGAGGPDGLGDSRPVNDTVGATSTMTMRSDVARVGEGEDDSKWQVGNPRPDCAAPHRARQPARHRVHQAFSAWRSTEPRQLDWPPEWRSRTPAASSPGPDWPHATLRAPGVQSQAKGLALYPQGTRLSCSP